MRSALRSMSLAVAPPMPLPAVLISDAESLTCVASPRLWATHALSAGAPLVVPPRPSVADDASRSHTTIDGCQQLVLRLTITDGTGASLVCIVGGAVAEDLLDSTLADLRDMSTSSLVELLERANAGLAVGAAPAANDGGAELSKTPEYLWALTRAGGGGEWRANLCAPAAFSM
jgi:hypothetical protein